jgi:hypothetical protein
MRVVLVLIQAFVALTALVGGGLLMRAPDGHLLQLPLAVLTHAPFIDFFWPGVLLFGVVGGGHAVGLVLIVCGVRRWRVRVRCCWARARWCG